MRELEVGDRVVYDGSDEDVNAQSEAVGIVLRLESDMFPTLGPQAFVSFEPDNFEQIVNQSALLRIESEGER